jgi:hypothetical protein
MKGIKIGFFLLMLAAFSSCRAHCGCPMAETEQTNTISPKMQEDGVLLSESPVRE